MTEKKTPRPVSQQIAEKYGNHAATIKPGASLTYADVFGRQQRVENLSGYTWEIFMRVDAGHPLDEETE